MLIMGIWTSVGKGIRYKEHASRKHGKKPDRYWCLQYKLRGRNINEAVGWWSDGVTQGQCEALLSELRVNQKSGQGPTTLKEMREFNQSRREAEAAAREAAASKNRTLAGFWELEYFPQAQMSLSAHNLASQKGIMGGWLKPVADKALRDVSAADLESLVLRPMLEAGRSASYIHQVLALFSVVWNLAKDRGLVDGDNPASKVKRPKADNQRVRFLSREEAVRLLAALREKSPDASDVALLSLFSGMRIGECLALTWGDVDFEEGLLFVKDSKNRRNRHAFITSEIREMLTRREASRRTPELFPSAKGGQGYFAFWKLFDQTVKELGFNEGLADRRQKLVIHSLRHTFASWLVQMGTPLYTVSKLMGHSSMKMTERYAHLAPDTQRAAAMDLEGILSGKISAI
ncbi:site-specific integrase [Deltaproteobacteria bacterium OttesenSCG-928-M10]|nr:site-specific integrase [Deltaproteobacteria bacterium OttesenSCG-928-M10]